MVRKLQKSFQTGPTAIACSKDPITLAKTLVTFSKSNEKLKILGGLMDEKLLEPSDVAHIATLPTLNEARAKIVGILVAPAQKIAIILLQNGFPLDDISVALDWRDFEGLTAEILSSKNFAELKI